jgi:regulator of sigma E protease
VCRPGSAAQRAGLAAGDRLRAIDGMPTDNATSFIAYVKTHAGKPITLQVERGGDAQQGGKTEDIHVVPLAQHDDASGAEVGRIGAELATQVPSIDGALRSDRKSAVGRAPHVGPRGLLGAHVRPDDHR